MFDFQKPKHWLLLILGLHAFIEFYKYSTFVLNFSMVITLASVLTAYIIYPNTHLVGRHNIKPLIFLVFWMAYNAFTFIWAEDKLAVIDHYQILARYFIIFWIYSVVFTKDHIRRHLQWFFAFVMLVYVLTSLWEIGTMNHLPSSRFYGIKFFIPTGPFFSENMLAAYLVMLLPFVLLLTSLYRIKGLGYLTGVITLLSFSIIVVQGARIGIIALVPLLLYCFIWHMGIRAKLQTLAFIALAVFIFFTMFTMTSKFVLKTFQTQTSSINSDAGSIHMSSIKIRKQLIDESIDIATSHAFMGAGGGNFEDQMNSDRMFRTAWISNSHNYLMELLGNWGIIIFFGFMILYMDWLIRLWYLFRHAPAPDKYRYLMYLLALLMYLPASILPSSIRRDYLVWVFFAAVNAVAYETINTKELS